MIKIIRPLCILGIVALLALFVLITGNGSSSPQKYLKKEKTDDLEKLESSKKDSILNKRNVDKQIKVEAPKIIFSW